MTEHTVERYDNDGTTRRRKPFVIRKPDGTLRGFETDGTFRPTTYTRRYDAERHARWLNETLD